MVWQRLATDLKPPLLKEMCRTIPLAQLPGVSTISSTRR